MAGQEHPRTPGINALVRQFRLRRGAIAKSAQAESLTIADGYELNFLRRSCESAGLTSITQAKRALAGLVRSLGSVSGSLSAGPTL